MNNLLKWPADCILKVMPRKNRLVNYKKEDLNELTSTDSESMEYIDPISRKTIKKETRCCGKCTIKYERYIYTVYLGPMFCNMQHIKIYFVGLFYYPLMLLFIYFNYDDRSQGQNKNWSNWLLENDNC